jgi:2-methylcitrate dehydratase PrpD
LANAGAAESLTAGLARLVNLQPVTAADREACALFVLDAMACIIGARTSPIAQPVLGWALAEPLSMGRRALVLGALSNILEMDSMHQESAVHLGTVIVPAALAVAMSHPVSGNDFLDAVLKGAEVAIRISRAAGAAHYRVHQATATCGGFGAAFAAGSLLGLDQQRMVDALGNAGTVAGGLWEFLAEGVQTKQWHAGRATETGVVAAQLAARGLTGPRRILEGERGFLRALCPDAKPQEVLKEWSGWGLPRTSYKPWPSPRHTHPAIDAALKIAPKLDGRAIERVELDTYQVALDLCNEPAPVSEHAARFSLRYCVAAALQDGKVDFASFEEPARGRNADLAAKVRVAATERFTRAYPTGAWGAEVRVNLAGGGKLTFTQEYAKGDPAAPMTRAEMLDKAHGLLRRGQAQDPAGSANAILAMAHGGTVPLDELRRILPQ